MRSLLPVFLCLLLLAVVAPILRPAACQSAGTLAPKGASSDSAAESQTVNAESARIIEQLRQVDPEAAELFSQAHAAATRGDLETASLLYGRVREMHPDFDHATRRLAFTKFEQGRRSEAVTLAREAVALRSSRANRLVLAAGLAGRDTGTPTAGERQEAVTIVHNVFNETDLTFDDLGFLSSIAFDLEEWDLFRQCVEQLKMVAPETVETAAFRWILALMERRHDDAVKALEDARRYGMSEEEYKSRLEYTEGLRPLHSKMLPVAGWVGGIWLGGLVLLLIIGLLLSHVTLSATERLPSIRSGEAVGIDAALRRAYQLVLWLSCVYYYISVPLVLLAVLGLGGGILYGFFAVGQIPIKLALLVVVIVGMTVWAGLKSFFVSRRDEDPGERLPLQRHPRLNSLLQDVAARIETRMVDSVYLTPGTDFAVTERGGMIERLRGAGERCLILGVGVLEGFRLGPFRAVLGHEYGHFSNRDTAGGNFALAVRQSLLRLAVGLARGGVAAWYNPAWLFVNGFHRIFLRISQGASRLQEVLADRFAAFAYGSRAFELGLRHVIARSVCFDAHANATLHEVIKADRALANLYTYSPQENPEQKELERAVTDAMQQQPSPYSSHPAPSDRIRWVQALAVECAGADDDAEAWSLFEDRAEIERWMTACIRRNVQLAHGATIKDESNG